LLWFVPMTFSIQVMSWISLSILIIYSWFKHLSPYLKNKSLEEIPEEVILGQVGLVIEAHLGHKGKGVLRFSVPILGTDEWSFSCDEEIEVGQRVIVEKITQNNLLVSIK
ncbi:MAG: hypothetical protein KAG10_10720, partial [Methylococcales bacterium]|nr:hypothetical protein [Methylococcales bacterium]